MSGNRSGRPWPEHVRARARELLAEHRNATLARRQLLTELGEGYTPARTTLLDWARAAGIELNNVDPRPPATASATAVRTELDTARRLDLSRLLRDELARPAAQLIAARLKAAPEDEELVARARRAYLDAAAVERQADDFGEDERREARARTRSALADLKIAETVRIDTADLIRITSTAVVDHLRLEEGLDGDEDLAAQRGQIVVVFDVDDDADQPAPQEVT